MWGEYLLEDSESRSSKALFLCEKYKQASMHMHIHIYIDLVYHLPRSNIMYIYMEREKKGELERDMKNQSLNLYVGIRMS